MPYPIPVEELVESGMIVKTHGIRGKVLITFSNGLLPKNINDFCFLNFDGMFVPFLPLEVEQLNETFYYFTFHFVDNINIAKKLTGKPIYHDVRKCKFLDNNVIGPYLSGYTVYDENGNYLGKIIAIIRGKQFLFELRSPEGKIIYLPAIKEFILNNERVSKKLTIHFPTEWKSLL
ncbi:MAG: hypothetical protein N2Z72_00270 [Bacteroidales bacterium]|nr:hypothetical protein [Bacteroidales bacterium]